jgi:hypothetical protein
MAESPVREVLQPVICILVDQLKVLRRQIRLMVNNLMPDLLNVQGVGPVVAGVLLAEAGDPKRFASANHFASYCGAAPVERGSGQNSRMQVNPGGNRRLNWALAHCGHGSAPDRWWALPSPLGEMQVGWQEPTIGFTGFKTYIARELFGLMQHQIGANIAGFHA